MVSYSSVVLMRGFFHGWTSSFLSLLFFVLMAVAKGVVRVVATTWYVGRMRPLVLLSFGIGEGGVGGGVIAIVTSSSGFWPERGNKMLVLSTEKKVREWNDGVSDAVVASVFVSLMEEIVEVAFDGVGEGGGR